MKQMSLIRARALASRGGNCIVISKLQFYAFCVRISRPDCPCSFDSDWSLFSPIWHASEATLMPASPWSLSFLNKYNIRSLPGCYCFRPSLSVYTPFLPSLNIHKRPLDPSLPFIEMSSAASTSSQPVTPHSSPRQQAPVAVIGDDNIYNWNSALEPFDGCHTTSSTWSPPQKLPLN